MPTRRRISGSTIAAAGRAANAAHRSSGGDTRPMPAVRTGARDASPSYCRPPGLQTRAKPATLWNRCASRIDREQKRDHLGPVGGTRQSVDPRCTGTAVRYIIQHFIQRERRPVVEERLWKGEDRKQRWWNETIRPERSCPICRTSLSAAGLNVPTGRNSPVISPVAAL